MHNQHHGFAARCHAAQQVQQFKLGAYIQKGTGLIQQDGGSALGQRHGKVHPLAFAAGKRPHIPICPIQRAGPAHGLLHRSGILRCHPAGKAQIREPPMCHQRPHRDSRHRAGLRHKRCCAGKLFAAIAGDGAVIQQNIAAAAGQRARHGAQQGGFAAAIGANQRGQLAVWGGKAHIPHHILCAIARTDML